MPMTINTETNPAQMFADAMQSGDNAQLADAWNASMSAIAQSIRADFEIAQRGADAAVLSQRGYRQLTAAENKFYENLENVSRSNNPKQAFIDLLDGKHDEDLMPVTIIEDVFRELEDNHQLLQVINFTYVGYSTKWLRNKHTAAKAVWGKITDEITKEITSDLEVMSIDQNRLTAFAVIPLDILDMGHTFMDRYVRACLYEALSCGLEAGILHGVGSAKNQPVGIDRDIHAGVSVSTTDGYPKKTAIAVKSFEKKPYLELVSKLSKTEKGKNRNVNEVVLVVNTSDYLTKVAPATMLLGAAGYVNDVFPFPTKCVPSVEMASGEALMFLPKCYTFTVGGTRNGTIEYDDSYQFLKDCRTYKIMQHGDGIADDDTAAILLDISGLEELIPSVKVANTVTTTATPTV